MVPSKGLPHEMAARRVQRPAPLRQSVYDALLDLIVTGGLRAGQHLVESELAGVLGVSRQPVREALQRLNTEGWVDLRPGQGAFVHEPTEDEVDQLLAVRTMLETEAARLAAQHADERGIGRLRSIVEQGLAALKENDVDALVARNAELHALITELSGNQVLAELTAQVDRRVRWYYTPLALHRGADAWAEHGELIDAIAAGDGERAAQTMREHTERTRRVSHESRRSDSPPRTGEGAPA